jgi:large subunit ribosomal protein L13
MADILIDASEIAMGRLATYAAKQALLGNKVSIINCNKAVITGKKHAILDFYKKKKERGGSAQKGPYISRVPEKIMKRTIRGMLPWKRTRGRNAFKLIKCYNGEEDIKGEKVSFKKASSPYLSLKDLSKLL